MSNENRRNRRPDDTGRKAWDEARRVEDEVGKMRQYIDAGRKMLMEENGWLLPGERTIAEGRVCKDYDNGKCYDGQHCSAMDRGSYNPRRALDCRGFAYVQDDGTVKTRRELKEEGERANIKREAAARLVAKISVAEKALAKLMDEADIDG